VQGAEAKEQGNGSDSVAFSFALPPEPDDASWHQQPDEKYLWYARFLFYLDLGPSRKLLTAVHEYERAENSRKERNKPPSKKVPGSWDDAYKLWEWKKRAEARDAWARKSLEAARTAYEQAILSKGYADSYYRIQKLDELAEQLHADLLKPERVWLPDVKQIGYGDAAERVDLITFNDALFEQYRRTLADIAAEKGERVKTTKNAHEHTGKNGGPMVGIQVHAFYPADDDDEDENEDT
jgi:hypothetical protein